MFRGLTPAGKSRGVEVNSPEQEEGAPAIGELKAVMGSVTIMRGTHIAHAVAGDLVCQNDIIETGLDGVVTLLFLDGSAFRLCPGTLIVLDKFVFGGEKSSHSALLRIVKGMFAVVAGKLAAAGRLIIETPVGQIQSKTPGIGIGSVAFGIVTFSLVKDLKAATADPGLLDDGTIDYNDLKHGVFEIVTRDGKHHIVDDVNTTLWVHGGTADELINTPVQMADFHADFRRVDQLHKDMLADPMYQGAQHAFAQPQSTGAGGGSEIFTNNGSATLPLPAVPPPITTGSSGVTGSVGTGNMATEFVISAPPLPTPPTPTILVPPPQTIGVTQTSAIVGAGQAGAIPISVSDTGSTATETFTVTLHDNSGNLSATGGSEITGNSTNTLTITGPLTTINTDLATLTDTNTTPGIDNISVNATDSFNISAAQQTVDVTVNGAPSIAAPSQAQHVSQSDPLSGVSVSETGNTAGETFTVTLHDATGILSATGGSEITGNDSHDLTITGSLSTVNSDLATLQDAVGAAGNATVTVNASDSFGNSAIPKTIAIIDATTVSETVSALSGDENTAILLNGISVSDTPSTGDTLTTTLAVLHGNITVAATSGVTIGGNDSGFVTLTGRAAAIDAALASPSTNYTGDTNYYGADSLTVTTTDPSSISSNNTITGTATITLTDTTTVAETVTALSGDENMAISLKGHVSVSDTPNTLDTLTTTLTVSSGSFDVTAANGTTVTYGDNQSTVQLVGTAAEIDAALAATNYQGNLNFYGTDNLTVTTTDPSSISSNNTITGTATITLADTTTVAEAVSALTVPVNLVTNGGFETGDLTGWTRGGNYYDAVYPLPQREIYVTSSYFGTPDAHSGQYAVALGSVGSDGTLSQTIQTTAGQVYSLSFWLENEETTSADDFTVTWDGQTLLALKSAPAQGYTLYTYIVTGTGSDTLEFAARQDPSQWNLDDVSLIPNGAKISLNGSVSVSDTPNTGDTLTTSLLVLHGDITVAATSGVTIDGNGSSSVTLTGTAVAINAALATTSYMPTPGYGSDSLTVTTTDPSSISSNNTVTQTVPITVTSVPEGPAGVAGSPINLALPNQPAAGGGPISVTISGIPAGWQLNEGTNLGNGTWTVETNDISALTILTAAAYAGATILDVTESWANTDGSTGSAIVSDNVEAYAPNSPIIAVAGDDTLTGAGADDLFVFAQPIGNDVIHNFNAASDQIDLIGFNHVVSFSDLQIADDGNGNAVITLGAGETITLQGVDAASITASNFVFDQAPVLENSGTMTISDGAVLPLSGTVNNVGVIEVNSTGDPTELQIVGNGVTLEGGGQVILSDNSGNAILGTNPNAILTNVDNTISGAGHIGGGDGNLTLVNDSAGTIDANDAGGLLTLDTGHAIVNYGVLEASNGGTLEVQDAVTGGTAVIAGGTIQFDAASSVAVTFDNGAGGTTYGVLLLVDPAQFTGDISGFTGAAPSPTSSDTIDLIGINFHSNEFSDSYNTSSGVLTVTDGTNTDSLTFVGFTGNASSFDFTVDASGKGTLITDPPVIDSTSDPHGTSFAPDQFNNLVNTAQQPTTDARLTPSVTIGGPDGDHFVFAPGLGAETVTNFNPHQDTIELDHFTNAQTVQELQSLITTDMHGDTAIGFGHNDSTTPVGVPPTELQHVAQAGHVLLH